MTRGRRHDLVVVGGGVAGWTAARRAQQLGLAVALLEKADRGPGFGNGILSGGWFHAAKMAPSRPPEDLLAGILHKTGGQARRDVAEAWAANVGRAWAFLQAEGATFAPLYPCAPEEMQNVLQPPRPVALGRQWQNAGPHRLLSRMCAAFGDGGGTFLPGHRATDLIHKDGRVVGVTATTTNRTPVEVEAGNVLLADGGFQGDPQLVADHITSSYKLRGSPLDTGDALRMGLAVGAATVNMAWFYGYPLCRDALVDDRLWPYPGPNTLIEAGVLVDGTGRRFVDEGTELELIADAIAKCPTPGDCWVVVDRTGWETAGRQGDLPVNPTLPEAGGTVKSAESLGELASSIGVPAEALEAAVAEAAGSAHHAAAATTTRARAVTLDEPPFYAVGVIAGITFAMGGLLVDGYGRVLDTREQPIAGLYAAGGSMGGLQGGPDSGYSGGWSEASTFGLLVAEHVAAHLLPPRTAAATVT
jgi:fumarate reductase flavoprotein subunit